jgi:hypothetical protein
MVQIVSQREAREARKLSFCYLCGLALDGSQLCDMDHVPPRGIFRHDDRNFPIKLPVHRTCNRDWQIADEKVKRIIDLLHGKDISRQSAKIRVAVASTKDGRSIPLVGDIPLRGMIGRITRGFHAALYREYLPREVKNKILTPIPEGEIINGRAILKSILPQFLPLSNMLRASIMARVSDTIISNNGKLRYESTWPQFDNGRRFCVFSLDIYDWKSLGDEVSDDKYACIGFYFLDGHIPSTATRATRLMIPQGFTVGLDPFISTA